MADPSESSQPFSDSSTASEEAWARLMRVMGMHDAVWPSSWPPSDLKVSANGSSSVTIEAGEGQVCGFYYRNSTAITRSIPSNAGGSVARNDMVCLEADQALNEVTVKYVTGGSTSPAPVRNIASRWQFPLALVQIAAGATGVPSTAVTDLRLFRSPGVLLAASGAPVASEPGLVLVSPEGLRYGLPAGSFVQLDAGGSEPRESWQAPPAGLTSGYANRGGDYYNIAFTRLRDGTVRLRGWFKATATKNGGTLFGLPTGYRPGQQQSFMCPSSSSTGASRIDVSTEGAVLITQNMVNGDVGSVDGISFMRA